MQLPDGARRWRLIIDERPRTGPENMAVDETLLESQAEGESPPTLRFYQWRPAALTIGYFQSFEREIDTDGCKKLGVDWVRRPTGGRAVLHDDELTYSVVISEDLLPGSVMQTYSALSEALTAGLRILGIDAQLAGGRAPTRQSRESSSAACFDTPTTNEVAVDGRKMIGSAQVRKRGVILQHGSVPLTLDRQKVVRCLYLPSERLRDRVTDTLRRKAAALNEVSSQEITFEQVAGALRGGFKEIFGVQFSCSQLTQIEKERVQLLVEDKYGKKSYNRQR